MISVLFLILLLVLLVRDSQTVINGASYGLMLWYQNVLPMLLPFMLISQLVVRKMRSGNSSSLSSVLLTLFLGVFCGYPIGAKCASDFVMQGNYDQKMGNILLPICNNSSPMFLSGYIVHNVLKDNLSFGVVLFLIYLPYIFVTLLTFFLTRTFTKKQSLEISQNGISRKDIRRNATLSGNQQTKKDSKENDDLLTALIQISYVGIYIMLCSIIIEFIFQLSFLPDTVTLSLAGITEITRGTMQTSLSFVFSEQSKTALILAFTSFGGISSILQTNKVIHESKLSILYYTFIKLICAMGTYLLTILLI